MFEFRVQRRSFGCSLSGLDVVEIEKIVDDVQCPFSLIRFDFHDLSNCCKHRVRSEVPEVPYGI